MHVYLRSFFVGIGSVAIFAACSSSSSSSTDTPVSLGQQIVTTQDCAGCHGGDFAGTVGIAEFPTMNAPNITPDKDTGVGDWTDAQLVAAIRTGVDDEGQTLCVMPVFHTFTDTDVANVIAYLRSLPAVSKDIPDGVCPVKDAGADASK
jgi:mono/diheme cytochrome c family protein